MNNRAPAYDNIQDAEIQELLNDLNLVALKEVIDDLEARGLKEAAEATKVLLARLTDIQSQLQSLERSIGYTAAPGNLRYVWEQVDYISLGNASEDSLIEANKYFAEEQSKADMSA